MTRPRFLCVAHDFPLPLDNGSSVRVRGMLELLGEIGDVKCVVNPRATTTPAEVAEVEGLPGVELVLGESPHEPEPSPVRRWWRSLREQAPPWFVMWFDQRVLDALLADLGWATHVVALDDFAGQYLLRIPREWRGVTVFDKHKVYGVPAARGEVAGNRGALRDRLLGRLIASNEGRTLERSDVVIVTTAEERARLLELYGREPDAVVPTGVEPPGRGWVPPAGSQDRVLWLGTVDSQPNRDGLVRLFGEMRRRRTAGSDGFELVVVGKGVDGPVEEAAAGLPVTFAGFVDDLAALAATCRVAVVPMWSGGGIRVKSLTLLGSGMPVVATPAALEGVEAVDGVHCVLAGDAPGLVAGIERLLADPGLAAEIGAAGRSLVAGAHTWAVQRPLVHAAVLGRNGARSHAGTAAGGPLTRHDPPGERQ